MTQPQFIKFSTTILDAINFATTDEPDFDLFLQNQTKSFLLNKQSFLEIGSGTSDIAYMVNELGQAFLYLSNLLLPKYKTLKGLLIKTRTSTTTNVFGEKSTTNVYFEPIANNTQKEVKNNGAISSSENDETEFEETETGANDKVIEFYDLSIKNIERVFIDFVNIMV